MPPVASALQACRPTRPDFPVTTRTPDHPSIRGPAKNVTLLATALRSATASVREFVRRHTPFLLRTPPARSHIGPMPVETYLSLALREFARLRQIADRAIAQLPPGTWTTPPAPGDKLMPPVPIVKTSPSISIKLDECVVFTKIPSRLIFCPIYIPS